MQSTVCVTHIYIYIYSTYVYIRTKYRYFGIFLIKKRKEKCTWLFHLHLNVVNVTVDLQFTPGQGLLLFHARTHVPLVVVGPMQGLIDRHVVRCSCSTCIQHHFKLEILLCFGLDKRVQCRMPATTVQYCSMCSTKSACSVHKGFVLWNSFFALVVAKYSESACSVHVHWWNSRFFCDLRWRYLVNIHRVCVV